MSHSGDNGFSQINGESFLKSSPPFAAIGDLDELQAWLSLLISFLPEKEASLKKIIKTLGSLSGQIAGCVKGEIDKEEIDFLEKETEKAEKEAGRVKEFLIFTKREAALLNISRTVCRRAERSLVALSQKETVSPRGLAYLNRLSTLLFWWAVLTSNPEV